MSLIDGQHVDRVSTSDPAWLKYSPYFNGHLLALYKIQYNLPEEMKTNLEDLPTNEVYFHGTGHCGCLMARSTSPLPGDRVSTRDWCTRTFCATRGILNRGHLLTWSPRGS
ncbi:hypothetical protein BGZ83_010954 [Gryganskiella cystojenkinii]|nr:hypothetical protein BGZ83_010954 [Gryganskiella cystojenkinii]